MVQCVVLKREAPGLERVPYPGELGQRIYEKVSKEAWARWLAHQTMLINEYRLTPIEPKARKFLETEMEKFFFGAGSSAGRVPAAQGSHRDLGQSALLEVDQAALVRHRHRLGAADGIELGQNRLDVRLGRALGDRQAPRDVLVAASLRRPAAARPTRAASGSAWPCAAAPWRHRR